MFNFIKNLFKKGATPYVCKTPCSKCIHVGPPKERYSLETCAVSLDGYGKPVILIVARRSHEECKSFESKLN